MDTTESRTQSSSAVLRHTLQRRLRQPGFAPYGAHGFVRVWNRYPNLLRSCTCGRTRSSAKPCFQPVERVLPSKKPERRTDCPVGFPEQASAYLQVEGPPVSRAVSEQRDHFICRHPDFESSDSPASKREVCLLLSKAGIVAGKTHRQRQRENTMERNCAKASDAIGAERCIITAKSRFRLR